MISKWDFKSYSPIHSPTHSSGKDICKAKHTSHWAPAAVSILDQKMRW